ncbi:MAG: cytochrome [Pseudonocardia sp.]|nr:cytochrome [Pseudonocardia sp.]
MSSAVQPESTVRADQGPDPLAVVRGFDIYDSDTAQALDEVLDVARRGCPVAHSEANGGYWLLTRYADVVEVLGDDERFSSRGGKSIPSRQFLEMPPLDSDPPEHRAYRRLLNRFFSKGGLAQYEPAIRELARALVDRFADAGRAEILGDFAGPLTGAVLCRVILDLDDQELMTQAQLRVQRISEENTPEAWMELTGFLRELVGGRPRGRDDVLDAVLGGSIEGRPLTEEEKLGVLIVLFLGGLDTTRGAISCIVAHLARTPGLEDRLRSSDWVRTDLDEFLRHDSVVTGLARTVTRDTELGGELLRAGEKILVHYYAANHDPEQFPEPDRLDFDRGRNPHVAFGVGIHRCLGSNLARLQIRVAFEELLATVRDIRFADGVEPRFAAGVARQPERLDVTFERV